MDQENKNRIIVTAVLGEVMVGNLRKDERKTIMERVYPSIKRFAKVGLMGVKDTIENIEGLKE
jgi:hypothetical protein